MLNKHLVLVESRDSTRVKCLDFHPTLPILIGGNHCGTLNIHNYLYNTVLGLEEHSGSIRCIKIHPSGNLFATGGDDKVIRIWNYTTKKVIKILKGHSDYIRSIDFHPTQPWIVSGSDDCTIKVWNFYTGELLTSSVGHHHYVMAVRFIDGTHIITGSLDHTINLWNCEKLFNAKSSSSLISMPLLIAYQTIDAHDRGVNFIYVSDEKIYSGSDDREIKVWKYHNETLDFVKSIYTHESNVTGIFYHNEVLYSTGEDNNLCITRKNKSVTINTQSRLWCVCGKDDYLAVGSDMGLLLYTNRKSIICTTVFYGVDNKIYNESNEELYKVNEVIDNLLYDENLIIQFKNAFEIIDTNGKQVLRGSGIYIDKHLKLENNQLYRDSTLLYTFNEKVTFKIQYKNLYFISDNKKKMIIYNVNTNTVTEFSISSTINEIFELQTNDILLLCRNKIFVINNQTIVQTLTELTDIIDGKVFSYKNEVILIFITTKQIKYLFKKNNFYEIGTFGSLTKRGKIFQIEEINGKFNIIFIDFINGNPFKVEISLSEILFKIAVRDDKEILKVIHDEQLPGVAPLEYLINNNRGSIAITYTKEPKKKFELYVSEKKYKEAYEIVINELNSDNNLLLNIGDSIVKNNCRESYEIAEKCYEKNEQELFYFFIFTNQLYKIKKKQNLFEGNFNNIVTVLIKSGICDDNINSPSYYLEKKQENIDNITSSNYNNAITTSLSNMHIQHKLSQNSSSENDLEPTSQSNITDVQSENFNSDAINSENGTYLATNNDSDGSKNLIVNVEYINKLYPKIKEYLYDYQGNKNELDNMSNSDSIQSEYITNNTDTINFHIKNYFNYGMDMFTQGKLTKTFEYLENLIIYIGKQCVLIDDMNEFIEIRTKISKYIMALKAEQERKIVTDSKKSLELLYFFYNQLKNEEIHTCLVTKLFISHLYKYGNILQAKQIIDSHKNNKALLESNTVKKILKNSSIDNNEPIQLHEYVLDKGELTINQVNVGICGFCYTKNIINQEYETNCGVCKIGIVKK